MKPVSSIIQLYMIVGLGIRLESMSVRSWRWTSLRLPRNPRIAARVRAQSQLIGDFFCGSYWVLYRLHEQEDWLTFTNFSVTCAVYCCFLCCCSFMRKALWMVNFLICKSLYDFL